MKFLELKYNVNITSLCMEWTSLEEKKFRKLFTFRWHNLIKLNLNYAHNLTDNAVVHLCEAIGNKKFPNLIFLYLISYCKYSEKSLYNLLDLGWAKRLGLFFGIKVGNLRSEEHHFLPLSALETETSKEGNLPTLYWGGLAPKDFSIKKNILPIADQLISLSLGSVALKEEDIAELGKLDMPHLRTFRLIFESFHLKIDKNNC